MAGRPRFFVPVVPALGACILAGLVMIWTATWLTGVEVGLPLAAGKSLGWLGVAALKSAIPIGALQAWRLWLIGGLLNLTAMGVAGWRMPISPAAIDAVGLPPPPADYVHATSMPQLLLGDSIPVSWPIATAVSIGDLVIAGGLLMFGWYLLSPLRHDRDGRSTSAAPGNHP